jgi:hypothetical protein
MAMFESDSAWICPFPTSTPSAAFVEGGFYAQGDVLFAPIKFSSLQEALVAMDVTMKKYPLENKYFPWQWIKVRKADFWSNIAIWSKQNCKIGGATGMACLRIFPSSTMTCALCTVLHPRGSQQVWQPREDNVPFLQHPSIPKRTMGQLSAWQGDCEHSQNSS